MIIRDLEREIEALESFAPSQLLLSAKMEEKEQLEHVHAICRLELQRLEKGGGQTNQAKTMAGLRREMKQLRERMLSLDDEIAPLAKAHSELVNPRWGLLMRTGNDKSNLARQIERYADIYTSAVSNLLMSTPFAFFRSPHTTLPHDPNLDR